jgi:RNA polymerase sigma factor (sigma-70 family)
LARKLRSGSNMETYPMTLSPAGALAQPAGCVTLARLLPRADAEDSDQVETALMAQFQTQRSEAAFTALYERSRAGVLDWLRWRIRQHGVRLDPQALLQDTYVNVFRYAGSFRAGERGGFRAWVRTIAANVVRRALSKLGRPWVSTDSDSAPELLDPRQGPLACASAGEETRELAAAWSLFLAHYVRAFATLRARDRRALELVEVEGQSYAEAAAQLGVSGSNMKMIMLRARQRLVAALRRSLGLEDDAVQACRRSA